MPTSPLFENTHHMYAFSLPMEGNPRQFWILDSTQWIPDSRYWISVFAIVLHPSKPHISVVHITCITY